MPSLPSATERTYRLMKEGLFDGAFPVGPLDIRQLGDRFRVSTTPVREALARLAAERLVGFVPNHGYCVVAPPAITLRNLYLLGAQLAGLALSGTDTQRCNCESTESLSQPAFKDDACYPRLISSLLASIARSQPNDELADRIIQTNDRLYLARQAEPRLLIAATEEAEALAGLWRAGDRVRIQQHLQLHYSERMQLSGEIARLISQRPAAL